MSALPNVRDARSRRRRVQVRGATLLLSLLAMMPVGHTAKGQAPAAWESAIAEADAAYAAVMNRAEERRRQAVLRGGEDWLRTYQNETTLAANAGNTARAQILQAKIVAAREAGKVPLPRPGNAVSFDRHTYALIEPPQTWHEAKAHCERMGGRLLVVDSAAEERFVLSKWGKKQFFVGAEEVAGSGTYLSLDGKLFRGFDRPFEADNGNNRQNVVSWLPAFKNWNDTEEGKRLAYVCEWE